MKNRAGFTLVELLVSMAVVALVMVMTVQLVGKAGSITSASNKFFDTASMARIVFDRIGDDLAGAALSGGTTMLYYSGSAGSGIDPLQNSSFGFVCKTRARKLSIPAAVQDVRGIVVGYKVRPTAITLRGGSTVNIPLINRGDAEFTFLVNGADLSGSKYGFSIWDMLGTTSTTSLPNDLMMPTADANLLTWQGFGDGVLRFHVSFVLDDGRIVQSLSQPGSTPPLNATYKDFQLQVNGVSTDCVPIAFSAATSADVNKHYVTGLIVGIAALDQTTLNVGFAQNAGLPALLSAQLKRPVNDGETPLGIWQGNLANVSPQPIRQNIRFYQRFYAVTP